MATAETLIDRAELYIGGEWVAPAGSGTIEVINASTEEVMGRIPEGTPEERLARRRDRALDVLGGALRDPPHDLLGRGVDDFDGAAARGGDPLASDVQLGAVDEGLCGGHVAVSSG